MSNHKLPCVLRFMLPHTRTTCNLSCYYNCSYIKIHFGSHINPHSIYSFLVTIMIHTYMLNVIITVFWSLLILFLHMGRGSGLRIYSKQKRAPAPKQSPATTMDRINVSSQQPRFCYKSFFVAPIRLWSKEGQHPPKTKPRYPLQHGRVGHVLSKEEGHSKPSPTLAAQVHSKEGIRCTFWHETDFTPHRLQVRSVSSPKWPTYGIIGSFFVGKAV